MNCNKCGDLGFYNEVLGKSFFYCRTCKIEIEPEPKYDRVEFDREYDTWLEEQHQAAADLPGGLKAPSTRDFGERGYISFPDPVEIKEVYFKDAVDACMRAAWDSITYGSGSVVQEYDVPTDTIKYTYFPVK